jgi:hypothetical protein
MSRSDRRSGSASAVVSPSPAGLSGLVPPPSVSVRRQRRPVLIGLAVALIVIGALGAGAFVVSAGQKVAVLALAQPVERGQVIERADLVTANVAADPALSPVPAARLAEVVGQRAALDLARGSLLTREGVTDAPRPGAGQSLVGVGLQPGQLPNERLLPGDRVRLVVSSEGAGEVSVSATEAEVVSVTGPDEAGMTTVDVLTTVAEGPTLAARVATGRVVLVLDSRARP